MLRFDVSVLRLDNTKNIKFHSFRRRATTSGMLGLWNELFSPMSLQHLSHTDSYFLMCIHLKTYTVFHFALSSSFVMHLEISITQVFAVMGLFTLNLKFKTFEFTYSC